MSVSESQSGTAPCLGDVLTLAEAAKYLRVAEEKLADLATDGGVPARRIGGEWRFLRKALDDWLRYSGRPVREVWPFSPSLLVDPTFLDDLLLLLESRLQDKRKLAAKASHKPGSKQAVLQHFGVFAADDDLEDRLADARARRETDG
jgi:excisionase family DNA binding protein